MKVCEEASVPYINQTCWFEWLETVSPFPKGSIHSRWFHDSKHCSISIIKKKD